MTNFTITTAAVERLTKLLSMLSSDNDHEALCAARAAHRWITATGLRWSDIIVAPIDGSAPDPEAVVDPGWRRDARRAASFSGLLSERDRDFLASIILHDRITPKQECWLNSILRKLDGGTARGRRA